MRAHEPTCLFKLVACSRGCGTKLRANEMEAHEGECPERMERCSVVGCCAQYKRCDAEKHKQDAAEHHAECKRQSELASCSKAVTGAVADMKLATSTKNTWQVVALLKTFSHSADVVRPAFAALESIVGGDDEAKRVAAGEAGAIEAVVAAMRAHGSNAEVQKQGCWALENMACDAENKVKAGSAGAIEVVVAAMRAHASNAGVQQRGCGALMNMTFNDENKVKAGSAGAIESVVAAMRAHGSNAGVQQRGCWALKNMTCKNAENKVKAGSAGAIEAVVAAMRAHDSNAGVQKNGKILLDRFK